MGLRGPQPKPTALKMLQGTARPDRMNPNEPKPPLSSSRPPTWLNAAQKKIWRDKAPALIRQGVLTEWDRDALARYCVLMEHFVKLSEHTENPDVLKELRNLNVQISKLEAAFGLTPSSRSRITATPPQPEETESQLEKMRRRARGEEEPEEVSWRSLRRVKQRSPA